MVTGSNDAGNSDDLSGEVRHAYDWSETSPTAAVVQTLAAAAGCDVMDLDPLHDYVDPDALETIVDGDRGVAVGRSTSVSFAVGSRQVTVHSDGEVVVRETE